MKYARPSQTYLKNEGMIAIAQSGDFFLTFTNEQNGCCADDDCGPPDHVAIPAQIHVSNGIITIAFEDVNCTLQGNIDGNGSFQVLLDLADSDNCSFEDEDECLDIGSEPNGCCLRTDFLTVTGTYRNGHLEASYIDVDSVDDGDPDCSTQQDCTETGDFTGDFQ